MKKLLSTLMVIACLALAIPAQAQIKFGVKAGLNVSKLHLSENIVSKDNRAGFFVGPTAEFTLPLLGLGIDGSVLYNQFGVDSEEGTSTKKSIEIPINLRWPGPAQAGRHRQPHELHRRVHQPAAREDRRHVRQPRDDARRPRAEVFLQRAHRRAPHRDAKGRRRDDRQPHARQDRQEQGRASVQGGGVRHHVRRGHLAHRRAHRSWCQTRPCAEERLMVFDGRNAHRPGTRRSQAVSEKQS